MAQMDVPADGLYGGRNFRGMPHGRQQLGRGAGIVGYGGSDACGGAGRDRNAGADGRI